MFWRRRYDISGKWYGVIVYGKRYGSNAGKELLFEADLTMDGHLVKGTATDISGCGVNPTPATISGGIIGRELTFLKQYAVLGYNESGNSKIDETREGHYISYAGLYNPKTESFSGIWRFKYAGAVVGNHMITRAGGSGTWGMSRILQTIVPPGL